MLDEVPGAKPRAPPAEPAEECLDSVGSSASECERCSWAAADGGRPAKSGCWRGWPLCWPGAAETLEKFSPALVLLSKES